jgi:hypothetical protein
VTSDQKPSTLDEMKLLRELVAVGPSGLVYRLRPLNLERFALAGGLPSRLRRIAMEGADAVNRLFATDDDEELSERGEEMRGFLDRLVRMVVLEPDLSSEEAIELVPPPDYRWLVSVAMGEVDVDGEGNRLWGRERLARFRRAAAKR